MLAKYVPDDTKYIFTKFYRHISTNQEANRCSPLSALNEANLTSATQTLNFNPTMPYRAKTSRPDGKSRN
jgi:hypothetical protein